MKIIITENQLKDKVLQMVKTEGWRNTSEILGLSGEELAQMFFNNDPMEFLNLFNDLEIIMVKNHSIKTYMEVTNTKKNAIIYNISVPEALVDFDNIYNPLLTGFRANKPFHIIGKWLNDNYDLKKLDYVNVY